MINEILDLSKVEAGKMPIDAKEVQLTDVQDYLERSFRPVADHKGLDFGIERLAELPLTIVTDTGRLHQILRNLLSNAFKFTSQGRVTVTMGLVAKGRTFSHDTLKGADQVIAFGVRDTGIGIAKDKQKLIFEAFQQADARPAANTAAPALASTISREIARLLGGLIEVSSVPGQGSTFTLYLPQNYRSDLLAHPVSIASLASEEQVARNDIKALPRDVELTGLKILVVDDDQRNIFAIRSVLEDRRMRVVYAENGAQAIAQLATHRDTALILMDVMMPEMDGFEAIQKIRADPEHARLPIISLTAKAMQGDREKCLQAGASDYITKPVDSMKLLAMMQFWLGQGGGL